MHRLTFALLAALVLVSTAATPGLQAEIIERPVSRAQAVSSILLSRDSALPSFDPNRSFADIPHGKWYEPYMRAAEQEGIVSADSEGRLLPEDPITRAEFIALAARTFALPLNLPFAYTDVPGDAWYAPYVGIAEQYRFFPNDPDGFLLKPTKLLTQEDSSTALESLLAVLGKLPPERVTVPEEEDSGQVEAPRPGKLQMYLVISTRRLKLRLFDKEEDDSSSSTEVQTQKSVAEMRSDLMMRVNRVRTANGLKPLKYNLLLEQSAHAYAQEMMERNFFSHTNPEGKTLKDRIEESGYRNRAYSEECFCVKGYSLAENLARGPRTAKEALAAWMKSPAHRAAILGSEYQDVGFGIVNGYWVQHFGSVVLPEGIVVRGITGSGTVHAAP